MVFSSHLFLFYFLPLVLLAYYAAPRRGRHALLALLSYAFYGWANPLFVVLMLFSTVVDYICGLAMTGQLRRGAWRTPMPMLEPIRPVVPSRRREFRLSDLFLLPRLVSWITHPGGSGRTSAQRLALVVSIATNLSLLGFFKYFNFGVESFNALVDNIGLGGLRIEHFLRVTLPLGISFYTFQSMSYSIDVYRGHALAIRNFTDFACYVSMFPQLVAGPIIRFQEVADQLRDRSHTIEKFARGVAFMCLGLSVKILVADPCGKVADTVFDAASRTPLLAWIGVTAYAFQIYFDFSAYSDMAIGLGLMFGFVFPKNFDAPYVSASITEFWRRWHISLSTWLRDYLYIPLGGNRHGERRTYVNLATVMLLGGLWHGASWNFVIWGGIHGVMLAFERVQGRDSLYRNLRRPLRVAITFVVVLFTWVFFRSPTLADALAYLRSMFGLIAVHEGAELIGGVIYRPYYMISMLIATLLAFGGWQAWNFTRRITALKAATIMGLLVVALLVLTANAYSPFIYFIF